MGVYKQHLDCTNIFYQALLDQTVYIELPRGLEQLGMVLELQQCVYWLRQSPLNFYHHLRQGMVESRNFMKSDYDDSFCNSGDIIVLFWVDNCTFYSTSTGNIDKTIESLKHKFLLERE